MMVLKAPDSTLKLVYTIDIIINSIIMIFILIDCAEANATADKSWHTDMEESDYFHNQTFTVYYQEVTPEDKNKTEKFHSGIYCSINCTVANNIILLCVYSA